MSAEAAVLPATVVEVWLKIWPKLLRVVPRYWTDTENVWPLALRVSAMTGGWTVAKGTLPALTAKARAARSLPAAMASAVRLRSFGLSLT